jgi:hypothetical protein
MAKAKPEWQRGAHTDLPYALIEAMIKNGGKLTPQDAARIKQDAECLMRASTDRFRSTRGRDDRASREVFISWLGSLEAYLDMTLGAKELYGEPVSFLLSALVDIDDGKVDRFFRPPPGRRQGTPGHGHLAVHFKAKCVAAADELYDARRPPGKRRSRDPRSKVDEEIRERVEDAAVAYGVRMYKGAIGDWRKEIMAAPPNHPMRAQFEKLKLALGLVRRKTDAVDWLLRV